MECHRDRNWHIDTNHSDLNSFGELTRRITIASEDGCAITVFVIIEELNCLLVTLQIPEVGKLIAQKSAEAQSLDFSSEFVRR